MIISQAREVFPERANASIRATPQARLSSPGLPSELRFLSFGSLVINFLYHPANPEPALSRGTNVCFHLEVTLRGPLAQRRGLEAPAKQFAAGDGGR